MILFLIFIPLSVFTLSPHSSLNLLSTRSSPPTSTSSAPCHEDLVKACRFSHYDKIRTLLSQGADVNFVNKNGCTPLYEVIKNNDIPGLQILLDHHVDVNKAINPKNSYLQNRGNKTNSPLFCAIVHRSRDLIPMLLEAGSDPNANYQDGWTCLTYAIWYGQFATVDILLKFGADVNQPSYMGTPLYLASFGSQTTFCMKTSQSTELVRQLLLRGADPNNIIQKSIPFGFSLAQNVHLGLGKEVLFHYSPLQIALGFEEWDIAHLLITFGADITYKNVFGETALHLMMQPLTQHFFHHKNFPSTDPLIGALQGQKYTDTLKTLLLKLTPTKESCLVKNIFGQTPLHMASLSQDNLLFFLKKRMQYFDIHNHDCASLGLDFLGRDAQGECIHPNPLASHKLALFDKERLLTGIDLPEILDIVKKNGLLGRC